jgi:hypothetical protein
MFVHLQSQLPIVCVEVVSAGQVRYDLGRVLSRDVLKRAQTNIQVSMNLASGHKQVTPCGT